MEAVQGGHRPILVQAEPEGARIVRHQPTGPWAVGIKILIGLWLVAWAFPEYQVLRALVLDVPVKTIALPRSDGLLWAWFCFWTVVGMVIVFKWIARLAGCPEVITVTTELLSADGGFPHQTQQWRLADVNAIRLCRSARGSYLIRIASGGAGGNRPLLPPSDVASTRRLLGEIKAACEATGLPIAFEDLVSR